MTCPGLPQLRGGPASTHTWVCHLQSPCSSPTLVVSRLFQAPPGTLEAPPLPSSSIPLSHILYDTSASPSQGPLGLSGVQEVVCTQLLCSWGQDSSRWGGGVGGTGLDRAQVCPTQWSLAKETRVADGEGAGFWGL